MAATLADFRARFTEFADADSTPAEDRASDALVNIFLGEARGIHNKSKTATLYCAAHLLRIELDRRNNFDTDGESSEVIVGPLSYAAVPQAKGGEWEAFFTRTEYGKNFLIHERRYRGSAIAARVVG